MNLELDDVHVDLLKFDSFLFGTLIATLLIFYNFDADIHTAIFVSIMAMAFIFTMALGLMRLRK